MHAEVFNLVEGDGLVLGGAVIGRFVALAAQYDINELPGLLTSAAESMSFLKEEFFVN